MKPCQYCKLDNGSHISACPKSMLGEARDQAVEDWRFGNVSGFLGETKLVGASPSYELGYDLGAASLTESGDTDKTNRYESLGDLGDPFADVDSDDLRLDDRDNPNDRTDKQLLN